MGELGPYRPWGHISLACLQFPLVSSMSFTFYLLAARTLKTASKVSADLSAQMVTSSQSRAWALCRPHITDTFSVKLSLSSGLASGPSLLLTWLFLMPPQSSFPEAQPQPWLLFLCSHSLASPKPFHADDPQAKHSALEFLQGM